MHINTFPPITVLYSTHHARLDQLHEFGPVMAELYAEAGRKGMINGPLHWIYYDLDVQTDGLVKLEIALPIRKPIKSRFKVKKLDLFKAISFPFEGPWEHLKIMQRLEENNIPLSHECRELFLNIDLERPENNITEIQIGLEAIIPQNTIYENKRLLPVHI